MELIVFMAGVSSACELQKFGATALETGHCNRNMLQNNVRLFYVQ